MLDAGSSDIAVRAAVLDFDGAVCPHDVTEELLRAFAPPAWWDVEAEMRGGRQTLREALMRQAALLTATLDEMLEFALERYELDATFPSFVRWAGERGIEIAVASDGLGFYIAPMLARAGIDGVAVLANAFGADGLRFPFGHQACVGCGTCKMNAVLRYRDTGAVAFAGDGYSDRFGALYADLTFAKHNLADICTTDGIPFLPWTDFDDVRRGVEGFSGREGAAPGPAGPTLCPGWTEPADHAADR
jgi:2-hydroxy-3-keto-5-methylthiopentenyl-1-phosphate phosphatase